MGVIIIKEITVLSNQIITISLRLTGILVARIHGTVVESIITCVTLSTPTMNLVNSGALTTTSTGRYISGNPRNAAFAANRGSGI